MAAVFVCLILFLVGTDAANPTGCTDDESDSSVHHYMCNKATMGSSLSFTGFTDSEPQRLTIYGATGTISSSTFNGFSAFSNVNSDYPATLQFVCAGSLTFSAATFTDLSYFEELVIKDCTTSLIASMFNGLTKANRLTISGGTLSAIDAGTFTSLDIAPIKTIADPRGELRIENVVLTPGTFPATFFAPITNVKYIYLEHLGLTTVDAGWFTSNTKLVYLSLANNQITTLPSTVLDANVGLLYLNLEGNALDCASTSSAWYYDYAVANNITFDGAAVCSTPVAEQHKSLAVWAQGHAVSTDACNGEPGVVISGTCIGLYPLICYCLTIVCLVFGIIALVLVIHLRRSTLRAKQDKIPPKGKPGKEKGGKGRSSGKGKRAWS